MKNHLRELTPVSILSGILIGIVMTAANVYLGLYAGMTVSASIPAAVLAMALFKVLKRKNAILECNIVQTMASAGESLAAGVIFTIPALVIVGAWTEFNFWTTTLIAMAGGMLGVLFMIPLRKVLIEDEEELTYPEGVACASVLKAQEEQESGKAKYIFGGLLIGMVAKLLGGGFKLIVGSVEKAFLLGNKVIFVGTDVSAALIGVGYIVNLEVAALVLIGGAIGWIGMMPFLSVPEGASALDAAWTLWSTQIRYVGVGAMLVGGIWSIISVRKGITTGLKDMMANSKQGERSEECGKDLSLTSILVMFLIALFVMLFLYKSIIGTWGISIMTTLVMLIASFLFVAVSSYVVGLVGSSNNPVSGMTISALLGTSAFFLILGFKNQSAILSTLGVAAIVCCAACTAGDCSQDLKTGSILKATPRSQQIAQLIGVFIPAFVIAPVLTLLHNAYGIGEGLKAPQATLFASITKSLFGAGDIPKTMVVIGVVLGVTVLLVDELILKKKSSFRMYLMPMAVGIYLPITLAVPLFIGGLIRYVIERKRKSSDDDSGILLSSGLIAGESIMGVLLAVIVYYRIDISIAGVSAHIKEALSLLVLVAIAFYLHRTAKK